jgi:hypothetical protein
VPLACRDSLKLVQDVPRGGSIATRASRARPEAGWAAATAAYYRQAAMRVNREIRRLQTELAELEERRSKLHSDLGQ